MAKYKTGDIIIMDFSPTKGHEQDGRRPALVVSVSELEDKTGMVWAVPITSATDKFPTHFSIEAKEGKVTGTVLCEHLKSFDPDARNCRKVDEATEENVLKCKKIIDSILYIPK